MQNMCIVYHITVSLFVMEMNTESEMELFDPYTKCIQTNNNIVHKVFCR